MLPVSSSDPISLLFSLTFPCFLERSSSEWSSCWQTPNYGARTGLLQGNSGNNLLLTIGLNPSRADHQRADPTWTRIRRVAEQKGYEGVLLLNIYPQRATHMQDIDLQARSEYHQLNLHFWQRVASIVPQADVWCAWGATLSHRTYFRPFLLDLLHTFSHKAYRYWSWGSLLSSHHPRHPLSRGKFAFTYADDFVSFDLKAYIQEQM